jgi:putative protein-disulfide isomerase
MVIKQGIIITAALVTVFTTCRGQQKNKSHNMIEESLTTNPLMCDPEAGACEMPAQESKDTTVNSLVAKEKTIKVIYFTDPICSSCWAIEPQLRKMKLEYGQEVQVEYHMGGLLPDWSYNSGGISKPSDVAHHWDEVSVYYDMPIDGDVWLEDPLDSSYPPSIAFKAAQLQDEEKAIRFLRELREMVFLRKKNIAQWEHIATAAQQVNLDVSQLKADVEERAKELFMKDLQMAQAYGVRGFPTLFFADDKGNREIVYGSKPYASYEAAILKLQAQAVARQYDKSWEYLFSVYPTLTALEFTTLSGRTRKESEQLLKELTTKGLLQVIQTKNGALWKRKL